MKVNSIDDYNNYESKDDIKYNSGKSENNNKSNEHGIKRMSKARIRRLIRQLLIELGENPDREGLRETPDRVADMYAEIFSGYSLDSELDVTFNEESDMIIVREIQFYSMCEHHILPFFGKAHIAYIPDGKVFGISKLVRLVEKYAKRLQIQERMTKQIADELADKVKGVLVVIEGDHMCMRMRGVKNNSKILTIAYRGEFKNKELREQAISIIKGGHGYNSYNLG
jgi:GTP cyclohydrolase I (EC 3.5.4.16)